ncbi:MAG: acyl-CoA dehydrogenase family protein [Acidimicrobiia bacterium]
MDFELSESALAVQEGVRAIASSFDLDYWATCDRETRFPEELWGELASGGWLGLAVPEEYGGAGQGLLEMAVAVMELAGSGGGVAASFLYVLTPGFGALTLARHGTEAQKEELLPGIAAGKVETCFALTEPDAGSNALAITTTATRDGDDFIISGQKVWISGVQRARWMIAVTRTSPAAEPETPTSGFTLLLVDVPEAMRAGTLEVRPIEKLGSNLVHSNEVFFDGVRVPGDRTLGEVDRGFGVLWDILNPERILSASGAVGHAELALRIGCDYARERVVFDKPIGANQAIAFPFAQAKADAELARLMTHKAAWLFDQGLPCGDEANMAKLVACQAAWDATDRAFQTHGGMAYSKEFPVERLFRDARIAKIGPVAEELILAHIATKQLRLPRSY